MVGVIDCDFCFIVCCIGGVGVVVMEFIVVKVFVFGNKKMCELMYYVEEECFFMIQIYGLDVDSMMEVVEIVQEMKFDICDINMGCLVNKVFKGCVGVVFMGDFDFVGCMICSVCNVLYILFIVKFCFGFNDCECNYFDFGKFCQDEGVDVVVMYGCIVCQMFSGEVDWSEIVKFKEVFDILVFGNGDVCSLEDVECMFWQIGCDGVMIVWGVMCNLWIFKQIEVYFLGGEVILFIIED